MVIPKYYYSADFLPFKDYLIERCDCVKAFKKGEYLNGAGADYNTIYYLISGVGYFYVLHESGKRSIISIHGSGDIYPLFRDLEDGSTPFQLEKSIFFQAMSDVEVAVFSYKTMKSLIDKREDFRHKWIRAYMNYINLLLYRISISDNDTGSTKVCDYLFSMYTYADWPIKENASLHISQEEIAEMIGMTRIHLSRILSVLASEKVVTLGRKLITICDFEALKRGCSKEVIPKNREDNKGPCD